jgi:hypothetical protein
MKLLFALSVIGTATPLLLRSMRPGLEKGMRTGIIVLPFLAAFAVALAMLLWVTPETWMLMLRGGTSVSPARCLACIVFFAIVPFAALVWALRQSAPTRLRLSGAIAGVVAGGLGAAAYAFACTSDTIPLLLSALARRSRFAHSSERNSGLGSSDGDRRMRDIVSKLEM